MSLSKNSLNNFTIHFEQQVDQGNHLGTFYLEVSNILGSSEILLHIVKQGKCRLSLHLNCLDTN